MLSEAVPGCACAELIVVPGVVDMKTSLELSVAIDAVAADPLMCER